jgi:hypothetical protein
VDAPVAGREVLAFEHQSADIRDTQAWAAEVENAVCVEPVSPLGRFSDEDGAVRVPCDEQLVALNLVRALKSVAVIPQRLRALSRELRPRRAGHEALRGVVVLIVNHRDVLVVEGIRD